MDFNAYVNLLSSQRHLPFTLFVIVFALLAYLETRYIGYKERIPRLLRWPNHILLVVLNVILFRLLLPGFCLLAAMKAHGYQFGVFNWIKVPDLFGFLFTIIFLDWMLYYLHRVYHAVPWLWKIHRVHHTDPEVDITTGLRFHPFEIFISSLVLAVVIFLLGAPIYGVFLFALWLEVSNLFNHSNIFIPPIAEKNIRWGIITPIMHRVHHSSHPAETNRNFGFIFSW